MENIRQNAFAWDNKVRTSVDARIIFPRGDGETVSVNGRHGSTLSLMLASTLLASAVGSAASILMSVACIEREKSDQNVATDVARLLVRAVNLHHRNSKHVSMRRGFTVSTECHGGDGGQ